jgi:hypothetical protein
VRSDKLRVARLGSGAGVVGDGGDGDVTLRSARLDISRLLVTRQRNENRWRCARRRAGSSCRGRLDKVLTAWRLNGESGWLVVATT